MSTLTKTKRAKEGEVERVYRILKEWLIQCKLPPGESLSELDLASRCDTSRTPIREACSQLAQEGWVTRIRHKGYIVTPVSIRDLLQTYEYRKVLECFATEKVAHIATRAQVDNLAEIIEVEHRPGASLDEILAASDRFHLLIADIAGNQRVCDQLRLTLEYQHRLDILSTQKDQVWIPHTDILSAVETRKPAEARQAMATHIEFACDRMLKLFGT